MAYELKGKTFLRLEPRRNARAGYKYIGAFKLAVKDFEKEKSKSSKA